MSFDNATAMQRGNKRKADLFFGRVAPLSESREGQPNSMLVLAPSATDANSQKVSIGTTVSLAKSLGGKVTILVPGIRRSTLPEPPEKELRYDDPADVISQLRRQLPGATIERMPAERVGSFLGSTQAIADAVARRFEGDPSLGKLYYVGDQQESLRTVVEFENAGSPVRFVSTFDPNAPLFDRSGKCRIPKFHREAIFGIPTAVTAPYPEWRDSSTPDAAALLPAHEAKWKEGIEFWQQRESAGAKEVVIAISAQHFLVDGVSADEEYTARIEHALNIAATLPKGTPVRFITVGKVHQEVTDDVRGRDLVSLGLAGKIKLLELAEERGINVSADQVTVIDRKVGNGEDEVDVISDYVRQHGEVGRLITVASHAYGFRKGLLHQVSGVPSEIALCDFPPHKVFQKAAFEAFYGVAMALQVLIEPALRAVRKEHAAGRTAVGLYADEVPSPAGRTEFLAAASTAIQARSAEFSAGMA